MNTTITIATRDGLCERLGRVGSDRRPADLASDIHRAGVFAVFDEERSSAPDEGFLGLVCCRDLVRHPDRIFADLLPPVSPPPVEPETPAEDALRLMETLDVEALAVIDRAGRFHGAITRPSLLEALWRQLGLLDELQMLEEAPAGQALPPAVELARLRRLHAAIDSFLRILDASPDLEAGLKRALEMVTEVLQVRYGAIGFMDENGGLRQFVTVGVSPEEVKAIGDFPIGRGLLGAIMTAETVLRIDDMASDLRSVGFPPNHPPMTTLLATPLVYHGEVYGRIYLCDKLDGEPFSEEDEAFLRGFARWVSPIAAQSSARVARDRTQEALRREEERYRRFFEDDLAGALIATPEGRVLECNPAFLRILGFASKDQALACDLLSLWRDPTERQRMLDELRERGKLDAYPMELRSIDGRPLHVLGNIVGALDEVGRLGEIRSHLVDVTERRSLEEQLRQAQKLEAVGRLAGGVAHDFNNLLQVIGGFGERLAQSLATDDPRRDDAVEILRAAQSASSLTRQLLAFSRQQMLETRVADLNTVVQTMGAMLRWIIGDDVELHVRPGKDLGRVRADVGQLQQVLMNLAVNARDAMPSGGTLIVETMNAELDETRARTHDPGAGSYVRLAVSDTGEGMDPDTRSRIFEPFFTTKEQGKGTGLGLATVYGIVKQSGGHIWVDSELGRGTTFRIYLPRVMDEPEAPTPVAVRPGTGRGTETILLVEDQKTVRDVVRAMLEFNGYTVLEAADARDAERVCGEHIGSIDLLLSDVVLPGASGIALAANLRAARPELRVMYMSGYAHNAAVNLGVRDPGAVFLQKPFSHETLTRKIRDVLDRVGAV